MKKTYEGLEMEVIRFRTEDIITTSALNNDKKIKNNRFWQEGYCPEEIFSEEFLRQKINYIHQNPVRQEIVLFPEQYKYSSAIDYAGEKGLLDVAVIK